MSKGKGEGRKCANKIEIRRGKVCPSTSCRALLQSSGDILLQYVSPRLKNCCYFYSYHSIISKSFFASFVQRVESYMSSRKGLPAPSSQFPLVSSRHSRPIECGFLSLKLILFWGKHGNRSNGIGPQRKHLIKNKNKKIIEMK